ncbi:MAG: sterol desaturase family protein [Bacteroidetes bacterium]|nr:sterol desaturase family protein [Bacteroidota bacterium]
MNSLIMGIALVILSFASMEGIAWLAHKYLMHGLLWSLHRDHHKKEEYGFFEHNDFFFLIFATPGITCLALGIYTSATWCLFVGMGITLYGLCYFLVHDVFIHQRIKIFRNSNSRYLRAIRRAHKMHHKHLGKEDGECFGMLWVPVRYFRESKTGKS